MASDEASTGPIGVTIITCGIDDVKTVLHVLEEEHEDSSEWHVTDLRTLQKDPSRRIGHKQDCTFEHTQVVVIGQDGFSHAVLEIIQQCHGNFPHVRTCRKHIVYCRTGCHRGSTTGAVTESQWNRLEREDGGRMFNAMWFPLHNCYGWADAERNIRLSIRWSSDPWMIVEGGTCDRNSLFGFRACKTAPDSWRNFAEICDTVEDWFPNTIPRSSVIEPVSVASTIGPVPPNDLPAPKGPSDSYPPQPEWATLKRDTSVRWQYLNDLGVDGPAQRDLFLLAQLSEDGYVSANHLLAKLVKQVSDEEVFQNISGFLHRGVLNARYRIQNSRPHPLHPLGIKATHHLHHVGSLDGRMMSLGMIRGRKHACGDVLLDCRRPHFWHR